MAARCKNVSSNAHVSTHAPAYITKSVWTSIGHFQYAINARIRMGNAMRIAFRHTGQAQCAEQPATDDHEYTPCQCVKMALKWCFEFIIRRVIYHLHTQRIRRGVTMSGE